MTAPAQGATARRVCSPEGPRLLLTRPGGVPLGQGPPGGRSGLPPPGFWPDGHGVERRGRFPGGPCPPLRAGAGPPHTACFSGGQGTHCPFALRPVHGVCSPFVSPLTHPRRRAVCACWGTVTPLYSDWGGWRSGTAPSGRAGLRPQPLLQAVLAHCTAAPRTG